MSDPETLSMWQSLSYGICNKSSYCMAVCPAGDLDATFHFTFTGAETLDTTIVIRDRTVEVTSGHHGKPNLKITADTQAWLKMLAKETGPVKLLLTRKLKVSGPTSLLKKFAACFPG